MHMPSPINGYFSAATAATPKTQRVAIDRKRMILHSLGDTSSWSATNKLVNQGNVGRIYQEEDRHRHVQPRRFLERDEAFSRISRPRHRHKGGGHLDCKRCGDGDLASGELRHRAPSSARMCKGVACS
jgi:hypothetical protein